MWHILVYYFSFLSELMTNLMLICFYLFCICAVTFIILRLLIKSRVKALQAENGTDLSIGFFHPYCNAGGGGEKVLWCAIKAIQEKYPHAKCFIYTGDTDASPEAILNRAKERFNITLVNPVEFIFLHKRKWIEANMYPYFTLLGQSLGSLYLGLEALLTFVPTIYLDTMGYAFTIPLFRYFGGCKVGCYVHYPTISTDMLEQVYQQADSFNNANFISSSPFLSSCKIWYYQIFAFLYGIAGRQSQLVMVNSSWTKGHILDLWRKPATTFLVYPPCDVTAFSDIPIEESQINRTVHSVISVAQFRPEKDHKLQILAFKELLQSYSCKLENPINLILVGGCRNEDDEKRVKELQKFAEVLGLTDQVEFKLNIPFSELKKYLQDATIGLHTMWNEHFGIGIVECMAAGLITLAHNSGGPKLDIVTEYNGKPTGYLATTPHEYAEKMRTILNLSSQEQYELRCNARESVKRFAEEEFVQNFLSAMEILIPST